MNEQKRIIDFYGSDFYFIYSSLNKKAWDDKESAASFLKRFWLPEDDYISKWLPKEQKIFQVSSEGRPDFLFLKNFRTFPFTGGVTFIKEEYETLKDFMVRISDEYFVIIQQNIVTTGYESPPILKLRFPVSTSWSDLMSGGVISTVLFEMPHNDYIVFGDSGNWGKYVNNDDENPLDLYGVNEDYLNSFQTCFAAYNAV